MSAIACNIKKPPGEIEALARGLRVYANTGEKRSGGL